MPLQTAHFNPTTAKRACSNKNNVPVKTTKEELDKVVRVHTHRAVLRGGTRVPEVVEALAPLRVLPRNGGVPVAAGGPSRGRATPFLQLVARGSLLPVPTAGPPREVPREYPHGVGNPGLGHAPREVPQAVQLGPQGLRQGQHRGIHDLVRRVGLPRERAVHVRGAGALTGVVLPRMMVVMVLAVGLVVRGVHHLASEHLRVQVHGGVLVDVERVLVVGSAELGRAEGIRPRQLQQRLRGEAVKWEAGRGRILQPEPRDLSGNPAGKGLPAFACTGTEVSTTTRSASQTLDLVGSPTPWILSKVPATNVA